MLLPSWLLLINLSILFKAHLGCLHFMGASLGCCISWLRSSDFVQTVLAMQVRVQMTLYLATRWWYLSHWGYWSVGMGFLYTVRDSGFSDRGFTMVSRNGMAPSYLLFFHSKIDGWVHTVDMFQKALFVFFLLGDKGVIHISQEKPGGWWWQFWGLSFQSISCTG